MVRARFLNSLTYVILETLSVINLVLVFALSYSKIHQHLSKLQYSFAVHF